MRGRKKRTLILGILCCLLVFMGVGFAVARTTLSIGGTSTAINTWDVRIANILFKSSSDGVTTNGDLNKVLDDGTTAEINVDFIKPGDYITFEFSVENNGSIDASIGTLDIALSSDNETDSELFDISNTFTENSKLEAGDSVNFEVTIKYKDEADKIPEGAVTFDVKFNYSQGDGNGGNIPGGGNTPTPGKDWDFEVDESGTIVAYNYDLGTDVVVPATNYEGKAITTITEQSFIPRGNIDLHLDESAMKFYGIVREDNTTIVDTVNNRTAAEVVVDKTLYLLSYEECQGDSSCIAQYKYISYICKDKDTCYNYMDEEKTIVSISETANMMGSLYINPEPNISPEESIVELERNIKTVNLSKATNLTTIGASAFYNYGLTDVEFGKNSSVTTVGDDAFSYNQISGELVIPNSVTTIGDYAFCENQIRSLTLGEGATTIGSSAFYSNQISGELVIPNSVTTIGSSAFESNQIRSLTLGEGVTTIGSYAFGSNQISGELLIPNNVTTIGSYAFSSNQISGELLIPNNVTTIEYGAFNSNNILMLKVPKSVTNLGSSAFANNPIETLMIEQCTTSICSSGSFTQVKTLTIESGEIGERAFDSNQIRSLTLGEGVTTIGSSAFESNQISELTIPDSVTNLGSSAFVNNPIETLMIGQCTTSICSSNSFGKQVKTLTIESGEIGDYAFSYNQISSLTLGEGVTTIGSSAFSSNQISGELVIPNSAITIGERAFYSNQISSLMLGEGVTSIGKSAFYSNQISSLTIPKNVIAVGDSAFYSNLLETLIIKKCNTAMCSKESIYSVDDKFGTTITNLTIESGEIGEYSFSSNQISELTLGEGVASIGDYAFYKNQISSLTLGEGVTSIGDFAFNSNQISSLTLGERVTTIGDYAFSSNLLETLIIKKCNTTICSAEYYGNSKFGFQIMDLTVESGEIGDYAFSSNQISSLTLGERVTTIGSYAFSSISLGTLTIPDSVTTIGEYAFEFSSIETLKIKKITATMSPTAFSRMTSLKTLTIESGEIPAAAFFNNLISNLKLGEGVTTIGSTAFWGNQISGELVIPNSVTTIGTSAFGSNQISSLTLGEGVTTIGAKAFYENEISGLTIPKNVKSISWYAFSSNQISSLTMTHSLTISYAAFNDNQLPDDQAFIYDYNNKKTNTIVSYGGARRENITIPSNVTTIEYAAFKDNQIRGELVIPEGVTQIASYAFSSNQISGELVIPESVTRISPNAFQNNQISSLTMTHSLEIGREAFNGNQLPDDQAFIYENNKNTNKIVSYGGARRENITIPSNVTTIGEYAF